MIEKLPAFSKKENEDINRRDFLEKSGNSILGFSLLNFKIGEKKMENTYLLSGLLVKKIMKKLFYKYFNIFFLKIFSQQNYHFNLDSFCLF